jgi:C4-dicarboxylate transporter, DctQ subunit
MATGGNSPAHAAQAGVLMRAWDIAEQSLAGLFGLGALVVGLWDFLGRYIATSLSSGWSDEMIVYLIVWAVMLAGSQLVRHDGHVRPDVVLRLMSPATQRWFEVFNCCMALLFCGGLAWYGWQITQTGWEMDERSSTGLEFPMYLYYAAIPTGGGLMTLRYLIRLWRYLFHFDPETMTVGHHIEEAPDSLRHATAFEREP